LVALLKRRRVIPGQRLADQHIDNGLIIGGRHALASWH
jgi:hypothetical protein